MVEKDVYISSGGCTKKYSHFFKFPIVFPIVVIFRVVLHINFFVHRKVWLTNMILNFLYYYLFKIETENIFFIKQCFGF